MHKSRRKSRDRNWCILHRYLLVATVAASGNLYCPLADDGGSITVVRTTLVRLLSLFGAKMVSAGLSKQKQTASIFVWLNQALS